MLGRGALFVAGGVSLFAASAHGLCAGDCDGDGRVPFGESADPWVAEADASLAAAREIVAQRHARLHDPNPARLLDAAPNPTAYPYGYLHRADDLCYWEREMAQLRVALGQRVPVPSCSG